MLDRITSEKFLLPFNRVNNIHTWIVRHTVKFIELRGPTRKNGNIQFLHRSVREFFLKPYRDLDPYSGLAILWNKAAGHRTPTSAGVNCVCYFLTHINSVVDFTAPAELWVEGSWSTFVEYLDDIPLLPYCMDHMKHHVKESEMGTRERSRLHEALRSPAARLLAKRLQHLDDFRPPREDHPLSDDQIQTIKNYLLHEVASECKGISVKIMLQLGAEVNSRSPSKENESALNLALSYRNPGNPVGSVVETLLEHGADLRAQAFYGGIPLHYAAARGHGNAVHQLLERRLLTAGARVHAADANGLKPIHWAAGKGHLSCVELLLKHRIDINERCNNGTVPLHWACGRGHEHVVWYLVENRADIRIHDRLKRTALRWAARYGHVDIVKYLISKGLNVNWQESSGRTALHWAALNGHLEVARILLKEGTDVKHTKLHGTDALSWAATYGHLEIVRLPLKHGAQAFWTDNRGRTLLHWSAAKGYVEVTEVLLETGLKSNWVDERSYTPLSLAKRYNHIEVVEILLQHAADPNYAGQDKRTPLFWAASYGHLDALRCLIAKGANVNAHDNEGENPLHWAASRGHEGAVSNLLKRYHADPTVRDSAGRGSLRRRSISIFQIYILSLPDDIPWVEG